MPTPHSTSVGENVEGEPDNYPDYYSLVGMSTELIDKEQEPLAVAVGSLMPGECIAMPMALVQPIVWEDESDNDILAGPVVRVDRLRYRRAFGMIDETAEVRRMNPVAVSIGAYVAGRG